MTFQPSRNTEVRISCGYVHSDEEVIRYPTQLVKLNTLSYFFNNKLVLGLDYLFNSRYSDSKLPAADEIYRDNRHVEDVTLLYNVTQAVSIKVIAKNLFGNDVPPMVFAQDGPEKGGLGADERRVYAALTITL